jgi:D-serine deaminase-like pyridoxal phosphate-dependent protein
MSDGAAAAGRSAQRLPQRAAYHERVTLDDLRTPAVLIERPRLLANIARMQAAANAAGVALRPHAKTHKSPLVAALQLEAGAIGICCAKLGEAEAFADAGIGDIRLPYPLQPANADRVLALQQRTRLSFVVDDFAVAQAWSAAMAAAGQRADVLVKVDVGFHRCGIAPEPDGAVAFLRAIDALPGLCLHGILSHAGHAYHAHSEDELRQMAAAERELMAAIVAAARGASLAMLEVSAGATPPARYSLAGAAGTFTEFRPGNYAYFDRTMVGLGAATRDDCALSILATVVSAAAPDRLVLDCGSKTLAADGVRGFTPASGHGEIYRNLVPVAGESPDPHLHVERLSEEHATVRVGPGAAAPRPGDRVRVLPNHACVVSNLVDQAWLMEAGRVTAALPIAARGRIQ